MSRERLPTPWALSLHNGAIQSYLSAWYTDLLTLPFDVSPPGDLTATSMNCFRESTGSSWLFSSTAGKSS